MFARQSQEGRNTIPLDAVFSEHSTAFVVTLDDRPIAANKAYLDFFGGAVSNHAMNSSIIPPVDDLFDVNLDQVKKKLYRLHNLRSDSASERVELPLKDYISKHTENGVLTLSVRVSGLGQAKLWEVMPVPETDIWSPLFKAAPIGLMSMNPAGDILSVNTALDAWVGEALSGAKHLSDLFEDSEALLAGNAAPGRKLRAETGLKTSSGAIVPVVVGVNWTKLIDGQSIGVVSVSGHSNILTRTDEAAGKSGAASVPLDALNQSDSTMAAIEVDNVDIKLSKIIRANAAFQTLFGKEVTPDHNLTDFITLDSDQDGPDQDINGAIETRLKNEAQTPVSVYIAPHHALTGGAWIYLVDISARRSLENQLGQSQKMQVIGQFVAGVAHNFNNLLQAIRLNADELLSRHPIGDPSYPELQNINSTITRGAALVSELMAFSRQQTLRPIVLNVGEAMSDIMTVLRQVMVERVKLDIVYGRGVPDILADKSQLETVLMNLCVNARDAMMEKGGGQITITTDSINRTEIDDPKFAQSLEGLASDKLAVISVSDNGSGIPEDLLEKIFEPFFTTKEQGKGTGLGLATVYGIVQQSGGHLTVNSTVGVGTDFRLYFPEVDPVKARAAAEAAAQAPTAPKKRAPSDLAGQGNILFVEDEDNVRTIAAKTLRKRGYNVLEACDGEEALELLDEAQTPFDLLISDVVMPGVDGPTLLKQGKVKLGEARIVFISGYAEEDFSELLSEHPDVSFLPKPFTLTQLAEKVKQEIGEVTV